jgi:hypothetical protein
MTKNATHPGKRRKEILKNSSSDKKYVAIQ